MGKSQPLTVKGFMQYEDGRVVPWDELSFEERLRINKTWINRLEQTMGTYYRQHPDELKALLDNTPETTDEEWERYYKLFPEKRESHRAANTVSFT